MASDIAVRLAELQGWTEINDVADGYGWAPGKRHASVLPRPDTDARDTWRLQMYLYQNGFYLHLKPGENSLIIYGSGYSPMCEVRHDGSEQGIMTALCEAAEKALTEA